MPTTRGLSRRSQPSNRGARWPDVPPLTRDEERDLARRKDEGDVEARDRLVMSAIRYASLVAGRYAATRPGFGMDEAEGAAVEGLMHAVGKFDGGRGYRLTTYSHAWIYQYLQRAYAGQKYPLVIPPHALGHSGYEPSPGVAADARAALAACKGSGTGRRPGPGGEDFDRLALVPARAVPEPSGDFEARELAARLLAAVPEANRDVVARRFGLGGRPAQTLKEIAADRGVTWQAVQRRHDAAMARMRAAWGEIRGTDSEARP